jgi:predicted dehydrogenase
VTLYGTEGGVELLVKNYGYEKTVTVFTDIEGVPADVVPVIPKVEGHQAVVTRFVDAVVHGVEAVPSATEGLRCAEVIDACYRSSAEGHEVVIED